ncbi:cocaine esterase [Delftia acidovorans]|uniref:CocE/NonD family hydrolase n=1 Tax=Delftia acidovorans TaxID=80866 RepID=UPI000503EC99|nr:CocE/NonD family hydrolase [Delftia acidovorans]KFJ14338.1 cocaine esterase [Delftia acidovorans]QQB49531.1 CocE/NonD family hydrolase [Delftia acidovorans]
MSHTSITHLGGVVRHSLVVPMRDGVRLATDLYLPENLDPHHPGPLPVLLERTPYGKNEETRRERSAANPLPMRRGEVAARFAREGYAVVVQDCRGRFGSEGQFTKYLGEAHDGADTLQWIMEQPWCNGSVGTYGLSYAAHTQTALATQRPPGLKAMFLECGGFANAYRGGIRHGGAFELKQAVWALRNARSGSNHLEPAARQALEQADIGQWCLRLPWSRGDSPLQWAPEYEDYLFSQWERGSFDDYWRQPELYAAGHYGAFDGLAVMLMCGWWDPYAQTTTDNYLGLSRGDGRVRMVLGPWTHGERSVPHAGDVDFGPDAVLDGALADDYVAMRLAWFDHWLKGRPMPARQQAAVRYFRMGGGSGARTAQGRLDHGGAWRSADHWPVPGTQATAWHLHADGRLAREPAPQPGVRSYRFDPACPVPTRGGSITSGEPLMFAGAYDQVTQENTFAARPPYGPLSERGDVLVFQTEPLQQDLEVTGTITIELQVSSSAPDTDFTAKLIDQYPPSADHPQGYAMNITDGILRCRYRNSWEQPELMTPGEVVSITIEPMPTSNLFRKGHRIRLDISSSNFPRFDVNPNTGAPEGSAGPRQVAVNSVHLGGCHASRIVLPVVAV